MNFFFKVGKRTSKAVERSENNVVKIQIDASELLQQYEPHDVAHLHKPERSRFHLA